MQDNPFEIFQMIETIINILKDAYSSLDFYSNPFPKIQLFYIEAMEQTTTYLITVYIHVR